MVTRKWAIVAAVLTTSLVVGSEASAHTKSIGYLNAGSPGSVTFWFGSWHDCVEPFLEGDFKLEGVKGTVFGPHTFALSLTTCTKPTGLTDGVNNFYACTCTADMTDCTRCASNVCETGGSKWQGVTVTGLAPGCYLFTYIPIDTPSFDWAPASCGVLSDTLCLSADVVGPKVAFCKTVKNSTGSSATGFEMVLTGTNLGIQASDVTSLPMFSCPRIIESGGNTFVRLSLGQIIANGDSIHFVFLMSGVSQLRTFRWLNCSGATCDDKTCSAIACAKQVVTRGVDRTRVRFLHFFDPLCDFVRWDVRDIRIKYYSRFVRPESLGMGPPPIRTDDIAGTYSLSPGDSVDIKIPPPPGGAVYRVTQYNVATGAGDPDPTTDYDELALSELPSAVPLLPRGGALALCVLLLMASASWLRAKTRSASPSR